jgi:transmembrane sensor
VPLLLEDGTRVIRAAATQIDVTFTKGQRDIQMPRGEAAFEVAHDASRPFRVRTPLGTVVAVGTAFKVTIRNERLEVDVTDGRVDVTGRQRGATASRVKAGELARLLANGSVQLVSRFEDAPVASVLPKSAPRMFTRASIAEIARAFNEQSGRRIFEVRGAACSKALTAVLDPSDPEDLLREVRATAGLVTEMQGDVVVIRGAGDTMDGEKRC